jgi:hypothetical protein
MTTYTEVEAFGEVEAFENEEEGRKAPPAPFWTVAIYLVDQAYGGPEEGGWWYQCGERVDHALDGIPPEFIFNSFNPANGKSAEKCAQDFAGILQVLLDRGPNMGRRDISSVLSTGRYNAQVYNGHPPKHYPERRPHYE